MAIRPCHFVPLLVAALWLSGSDAAFGRLRRGAVEGTIGTVIPSSERITDYLGVAAAQDRREPVPPPHPSITHTFIPKASPSAASAPSPPPTPTASNVNNNKNHDKTLSGAHATAAAAADSTMNNVNAGDALNNYNEFLSRNTRFSQSLGDLFRNFDLNGDGSIDIRTELPKLVAADTISQEHANIIASWDLDGDHLIRQNEFLMGPLYVSMLAYAPEKKRDFERAVATSSDTSAITHIFSRLAKGDSSDLVNIDQMRFVTRDASGQSEEEAEEEAEAAEAEEELRNDDTARFAQRHGRRPPSPQQRSARKQAIAAALLAQKRPRSRHGIPSERDEHCVMCQFMVQRIQKQLFYTLANSADGFPADPNQEVTDKQMRQVNSQLLNRRGGKGLLRILAEDVVSDMCDADQMPELYYSACRKLDDVFPTLLDAIYFQFHSEAVCEEARMCGRRTYFNRNSSVHLPSKSKLFNSGRGKCGLVGGAHERPSGRFSAALCFSRAMFVQLSEHSTPS